MAVIFDLGRVVVRWDPVAIVSGVRGPEGATAIAELLFNHPDWLEVDRGTLSLHTMARQAQGRTGLSMAENLAILQAVPSSLVPDPAMVALIEELHGAGHPLYALSNMGHASIDWLEQHQSFWRFFSGKVVSARVRMLKPEPDIYRYLLVSFDLKAWGREGSEWALCRASVQHGARCCLCRCAASLPASPCPCSPPH